MVRSGGERKLVVGGEEWREKSYRLWRAMGSGVVSCGGVVGVEEWW